MTFLVDLIYQTPAGNPGGCRYQIKAKDYEAADAEAQARLRKRLPGVKIHGGTIEEITA